MQQYSKSSENTLYIFAPRRLAVYGNSKLKHFFLLTELMKHSKQKWIILVKLCIGGQSSLRSQSPNYVAIHFANRCLQLMSVSMSLLRVKATAFLNMFFEIHNRNMQIRSLDDMSSLSETRQSERDRQFI